MRGNTRKVTITEAWGTGGAARDPRARAGLAPQ
jgi:hypothetical protein